MNLFTRINTPFGFPIYYQRMPEMVKSVSLSWLVFTGGADDESVGHPGLYHWFEHVPFRGTERYPNGYQSIKGPFVKYGGEIGAWTSMVATRYYAFVPVTVWKSALNVITDLFARPLITDEGVKAEREIIFQEIARSRSNFGATCSWELNNLMFKGHPFGHHVLGTEETLRAMTPDCLREAHVKGYDISRSALIVAGNIEIEELLSEIDSLSGILPQRGLSSRQSPAFHGKVDWPREESVSIRTDFASSMVYILFPMKGNMADNLYDSSLFRGMFGFGGLASPIYRKLREELNLVYSTGAMSRLFTSGSYAGFVAETKLHNIPAVIDAFRKLSEQDSICTEERLAEVKSGTLFGIDMEPICPEEYADDFISTLLAAGKPINEDEWREIVVTRQIGDARRAMSIIDPQLARTVIFEGR